MAIGTSLTSKPHGAPRGASISTGQAATNVLARGRHAVTRTLPLDCIGAREVTDQLQLIEQTATDAALQAAGLVAGRFGKKLDVSRKPHDSNTLVTDADFASQKLIADIVAARFPDHVVLGEEDKPDDARPAAEFVWAVDPIDGTTNFVNGMPVYAVSIGVLQRGRPVVAACALPWPGEPSSIALHARKGAGAWLGERRLQIQAGATNAAPTSGRIAAVPGGLRRSYRLSKEYMKAVGEVRQSGSAVYDQALVALGIAGYSITGPARIWDFAAGVLIVREAGGVAMTPVDDTKGGKTDRWRPLESFATPYGNDGDTLKRMRAWYGQVLLGSPDIVDYVTGNVRPRRPSTVGRLRRMVLTGHRRKNAGPARDKPGK